MKSIPPGTILALDFARENETSLQMIGKAIENNRLDSFKKHYKGRERLFIIINEKSEKFNVKPQLQNEPFVNGTFYRNDLMGRECAESTLQAFFFLQKRRNREEMKK